MNTSNMVNRLADQLSEYYQADPEKAAYSIEKFLDHALKDFSPEKQTDILDDLLEKFSDTRAEDASVQFPGNHAAFNKVFSLILGRSFESDLISPEKQLEKLAESLNTLFDALNNLISIINSTLCSSQDKDATIRQVIGYHMHENEHHIPLETYIGQISKAFLAVREASNDAAHEKTREILMELSPARLEKEAGVTKLNPLRRAKCYSAYEIKFNKFKKWFESGRFTESYLREFEKQCQKISFN
ncbi:MAG: hypothetical protein R6U68_12595 [Desulfobacteraceae bacterium]